MNDLFEDAIERGEIDLQHYAWPIYKQVEYATFMFLEENDGVAFEQLRSAAYVFATTRDIDLCRRAFQSVVDMPEVLALFPPGINLNWFWGLLMVAGDVLRGERGGER